MRKLSLAALGHLVLIVTLIIGKLRLRVWDFFDSEDAFRGCNVLLGMSWIHSVRAMLDAYNEEISLTHSEKSVVLDVKLKGEFVSIVLASTTSEAMNHILPT